jgi:ribosomal protein S18 acetylase RimI-like enzyme
VINIRVDDPKIGLDNQHFEDILRALPQWFGIESAIQHYVESVYQMPTVLAYVDNRIAGFLSIKHHNPFAAEIYVMGVYPQYHRQGVGKTMVAHIEAILRSQDFEFLQVKTLLECCVLDFLESYDNLGV